MLKARFMLEKWQRKCVKSVNVGKANKRALDVSSVGNVNG